MFESPEDDSRVQLYKLIELARTRDEQAFTTLFNYYSPGICGYLAGMVSHLEDRDELAQETFLRAWKELPNLRHPSRFKPWLYRIATNIAHDYHRRHQSRLWPFPLEDFEGFDDPKNFEEGVAEKELVKQALKEMPWKYRACLLLEIEGKLSRKEIAEAVGISEKSVSTYTSYGRQRFRQAYYRLENERTILEERRIVP